MGVEPNNLRYGGSSTYFVTAPQSLLANYRTTGLPYHTGDKITTPLGTMFRADYLQRKRDTHNENSGADIIWHYLVDLCFHRHSSRRLCPHRCRENQLGSSSEGVCYLACCTYGMRLLPNRLPTTIPSLQVPTACYFLPTFFRFLPSTNLPPPRRYLSSLTPVAQVPVSA